MSKKDRESKVVLRRRLGILRRLLLWVGAYCGVAYLTLGVGPVEALSHPGYVFEQLMPMLFQGLILMSFMVMQFVAMFWFLARGSDYTLYPGEYNITFNDVRGQPAAVGSAREVLKLFQGFKDFKAAGGYPPHGILFEGPPGTGKTLIAKAIAGETGVPFIYASGSSFAAMFMGITPMKIRRMFKRARKFSDKYGGCVVFIDELDALGGSRGGVTERLVEQSTNRIVMGGMGMGGGGVNELLVQMDGFTMPRGLRRHVYRLFRMKPRIPTYNILIIAATNRASSLDPALLRPGRFDRKVHVGNPDAEGRADIAQYYLDKVQHEPVDVRKLASATRGYSPAKIMNVVNEALIVALQDGRSSLRWSDLWQAKVADEIGLRQPVRYTPREKRMIATHEAAHAVVAYLLRQDEQVVQIVTIQKRENALGLVSRQDLDDFYLQTREQVRDDIAISLAGMVAEQSAFGTSTSGPASDLEAATVRAALYVGIYGMGQSLSSMALRASDGLSAQSAVQATLADTDRSKEVEDLLQTERRRTASLLERNAVMVDGLRDALLEREELIGDEIVDLLRELEKREEVSFSDLAAQLGETP